MTTLFYFESKHPKYGWEEGSGSCVQFFWKNHRGAQITVQGQLHRDYEKTGDGIFWVMQRSHVLKAVYTRADEIEKRMYNNGDFLTDGEIVEIITADLENGEVKKRGQYKVKLLGDYSDCAVFEEVA